MSSKNRIFPRALGCHGVPARLDQSDRLPPITSAMMSLLGAYVIQRSHGDSYPSVGRSPRMIASVAAQCSFVGEGPAVIIGAWSVRQPQTFRTYSCSTVT